MATVVTTTSVILGSNKIQNGDILVPANPGWRGKWLLQRREQLLQIVLHCYRKACVVSVLQQLTWDIRQLQTSANISLRQSSTSAYWFAVEQPRQDVLLLFSWMTFSLYVCRSRHVWLYRTASLLEHSTYSNCLRWPVLNANPVCCKHWQVL